MSKEAAPSRGEVIDLAAYRAKRQAKRDAGDAHVTGPELVELVRRAVDEYLSTVARTHAPFPKAPAAKPRQPSELAAEQLANRDRRRRLEQMLAAQARAFKHLEIADPLAGLALRHLRDTFDAIVVLDVEGCALDTERHTDVVRRILITDHGYVRKRAGKALRPKGLLGADDIETNGKRAERNAKRWRALKLERRQAHERTRAALQNLEQLLAELEH